MVDGRCIMVDEYSLMVDGRSLMVDIMPYDRNLTHGQARKTSKKRILLLDVTQGQCHDRS